MDRISCFAALLLAACPLVGGASAAENKPQNIPGFGAVVDPDGDCKVIERPKLSIVIPGTIHDLTYRPEPGQDKQNAPRILHECKGDFQLAVKVEPFPNPKTKASTNGRPCHTSAGILVWQDEQNFIRFERAASGGPGAPWIYAECFANGQSIWRKKLTIDDKIAFLRLTRNKNKLELDTSKDGHDWDGLQAIEAELPEKLMGGVLAINTSIEPLSVTIEDLTPIENQEASDSTPTDKAAQTVPGVGTLLDPDGDCKVTFLPKVTISVPGTNHDLALEPKYTKQNAPRVVDEIKGDFVLTARVEKFPTPKPNSSSNGRLSAVSAGLLLWQDEKNYIRFERAAEGNAASHSVLIERHLKGAERSSMTHDIQDVDTFLRLTRVGDKFTFEVRDNGQDWTTLKSEELKLPEKLKLGIAAINTTSSEFSATIEVPVPEQTSAAAP